jgi:CheY-like chemotaxis protein
VPEITIWQILFVDDDSEICDQAKEFLEEEPINSAGDCLRVKTITDFDDALIELEKRRFDILVLDVRLESGPVIQKDKGRYILEDIKRRRFIPVVFYTALPNQVRDEETARQPLVQIVEKTQGVERLLDVLKDILLTDIPLVNRALIHHLETVQRNYMWDFVTVHWKQLGEVSDRVALAYLLARRLAMSLSGPGIQQLARDLGDSTGADTIKDRLHPMQYYVMPPVEPAPMAGDLYQGQIGEQTGYWVLLTPSCDLVTGRRKAKWVLFARCPLLTEQEEYQIWHKSLPNPTPKSKGRLEALLKNNRQGTQSERFYFLPGALILPDLVVDFQQLTTLPENQMDNLKRLASLDNPFAEALLALFARYFGRIGTPDLDVGHVLDKLVILSKSADEP